MSEATTNLLTPAQMSERTGVSIDTLRYYEREGLLGAVERNTSGHRRYDHDDVLWVQVLRCLRGTGMSIQDLHHYCELGKLGARTEAERYQLLSDHRSLVRSQIDDLQAAIAMIDHKMSMYPQHGNT